MSLSRWLIYRKISKALYTRPCIVTVFDKFLISCYSRIKVCIARSLDMFYDTNMFICLFQNRKKWQMFVYFIALKLLFMPVALCACRRRVQSRDNRMCEFVRMKSENFCWKLFRTHILGIFGLHVIVDHHVFKYDQKERHSDMVKDLPHIFVKWPDL